MAGAPGRALGACESAMADLREYETWAKTRAFQRRVDTARRIVEQAEAMGPVCYATSWGKDSIAMLGVAIEMGGRPRALHLGSPYGLPGYDDTARHFEALCDVTTLPASRTLPEYIAWCREIGLPHERARSVQGAVVASIKRDRGADWARENGIKVQALGMRIAEGGPRAKVLRARGPVYTLADGSAKACPLAWWTSRDVWAFIASRGLPYNGRLYDAETHGLTRETIRNTGWLSTDGAAEGRVMWLRQHFNEQWRALRAAFPQVAALS